MESTSALELRAYWDRGRPARMAPTGTQLKNFSRFALIAGGTPAVPVMRSQ